MEHITYFLMNTAAYAGGGYLAYCTYLEKESWENYGPYITGVLETLKKDGAFTALDLWDVTDAEYVGDQIAKHMIKSACYDPNETAKYIQEMFKGKATPLSVEDLRR